MNDREPIEALEADLIEWSNDRADLNERRNCIVRAAHAAGISKHRIYVLSGIARTTIDDILSTEVGEQHGNVV